jgi:hypothetical protein
LKDSNNHPQILFIGWCQTLMLMKLKDGSHNITSLTQKPQFLQFLNTQHDLIAYCQDAQGTGKIF